MPSVLPPGIASRAEALPPYVKGGGTGRIASIDAFRGLTILIMVFVNDVAGVTGIPAWMKHAPSAADMMTFVDVVFPAFLFIVGMSIPFALTRRYEKGSSTFGNLVHVLIRTVGLLIIGIFMVNMPADSVGTGMNANLWTLLVYLCVIVAWNSYPSSSGFKRVFWTWVRIMGLAGLVYLGSIYKGQVRVGPGETEVVLVGMRPQWYGILGLIGWAYLVGCVAWLFFRKQHAALMGMLALLTVVYIADQNGAFRVLGPVRAYIGIGTTLGSQPSIVMAGIIVSMLFFPDTPAPTVNARIKWILLFAAGLAAAGFWLRPLYGISKDNGTPAWCLLCSAICCVIYAFLYWLMDVRDVKKWAKIIQPAGENPLLAYILPSIFYAAIALWPKNPLESWCREGWIGVVRSAVFAFCIVGLTWVLTRMRLRLRL